MKYIKTYEEVNWFKKLFGKEPAKTPKKKEPQSIEDVVEEEPTSNVKKSEPKFSKQLDLGIEDIVEPTIKKPSQDLDLDYFPRWRYDRQEPKKLSMKEIQEITDIEVGDDVEAIDFEGLTEPQAEYLRSQKYFTVSDITDKNGEVYCDVGYRIPLKVKRFKKVEVHFDHRILFLNYDLKIDTHGEPDPKDIFRSCTSMPQLFPLLINEKLPNTKVDFCSYKDVYRLRDGYYIKNINLKDYDFVFFGFMSKYSKESILLINYLDKVKVPYLKYETFDVYDSKSFGMDLTESLGYNYIPTILATNLNNRIIRDVEEFGFPVIVKDPNLDRGTGVDKIDTLDELVTKFRFNSKQLMIQKFIPNDGDTRVIVIKNKVELVVKRQMTSETEFRSNVALGGKAIPTTLPQEILDMCEDLSKHVPVCDILGFDIIKDLNDGTYYVMEINISPHISTFCVVTGIDIPGIIVDYMVKSIEKV